MTISNAFKTRLVDSMKKLGIAAIVLANWQILDARADSLSNPREARAMCERGGRANTTASLKSCCSGLLMGMTAAQQKKLEAECVSGKPQAAAGSAKSK